jgi:hypothetical protein
MQETPPDVAEIEKCEMEGGRQDEDGNTTWAVEVPEDASVRVELVVRSGPTAEEIVGGTGNLSGRYELTHKE